MLTGKDGVDMQTGGSLPIQALWQEVIGTVLGTEVVGIRIISGTPVNLRMSLQACSGTHFLTTFLVMATVSELVRFA